MQNKNRIFTGIIMGLLMLLTSGILNAREVIKYQGNDQLEVRWQWAEKEAQSVRNLDAFWIGYSIKRSMSVDSHFGRYSDDGTVLRSLSEILNGEKYSSEKLLNTESEDGERMVIKDVALLFKMQRGANNEAQLKNIWLTDLAGKVDLDQLPLIWLGLAEKTSSVKHLTRYYSDYPRDDLQEDIIAAIGIHKKNDDAYQFLKNIVMNEKNSELREKAAFWIGLQENPEALSFLLKTAKSDKDEDVREKAVFALSLIDTEAATDELIKLARSANNPGVRKKAVFWLSQKASEKVLKTLEEVVFDDEETELQKHAVFALSQLPADQSVNSLIKVAETHPNPAIRKKAVFWLGQCDDDRALEAIIGFLKQ